MFSTKARFIVLALSSIACAQSALTNDTVRKLAASGMPDETVIRIVNTQPGAYFTASGDLADLRQAGVSPAVIAALVAHQESAATAAGPTSAQSASPAGSVLLDGTPVRLRLTRTLSSAEVSTGEKIDFDVLDDIRLGDRIVIPRGTKAIGAVTQAEQRKRMGRGGKLNLVLEYVRLADGTKAALRAERVTTGGGHVGAMTAGMVATSLVIWPAAPFFLMMHGKDAVIPEGTEITAYVNGDTQLSTTSAAAGTF